MKYPDAFDPQGMTEESILDIVIAAVQESLASEGVQIQDITPDQKLISLGLCLQLIRSQYLGLDSSKIPYLQEMLCRSEYHDNPLLIDNIESLRPSFLMIYSLIPKCRFE